MYFLISLHVHYVSFRRKECFTEFLQKVFEIISVYYNGTAPDSVYIIKFYLELVKYELMRSSDQY